jgi:hypothetical protein
MAITYGILTYHLKFRKAFKVLLQSFNVNIKSATFILSFVLGSDPELECLRTR